MNNSTLSIGGYALNNVVNEIGKNMAQMGRTEFYGFCPYLYDTKSA